MIAIFTGTIVNWIKGGVKALQVFGSAMKGLKAIKALMNGARGVMNAFKKIGKVFKKLGSKLGGKLGEMWDKVMDFFKGILKWGDEAPVTQKLLPTPSQFSNLISKVNSFRSQAKSGKLFKFISENEMIKHFNKHATQIMNKSKKSLYTLKDYLTDARNVIAEGTPVTFTSGPHAGSINFIRYVGSSGKKIIFREIKTAGEATLEVVGMTQSGEIVTYTFKKASQLDKWGMQLLE